MTRWRRVLASPWAALTGAAAAAASLALGLGHVAFSHVGEILTFATVGARYLAPAIPFVTPAMLQGVAGVAALGLLYKVGARVADDAEDEVQEEVSWWRWGD